MSDTTFIDQETVIHADWLNDTNDHVYNDTPVAPATTVHAASKIANTPAGNIAATTVQAAINELDVEKALLAGSASQTFSVAPATAAAHAIRADEQRVADNPIINGEMLVDQRNAGAAVTVAIGTTAATTPTVDMHHAWAVGATVQAQQVAGSNEFKKVLQFTGATSVTQIGHGTRIEAKNSARFTNKTVTLNVWMSNSLLTSVSWTAYSLNAEDVFGTNGNGAKTQIATGTMTLAAADTTLREYSATFNAGANAGKGVVIEFAVGAQTSGTWVVSGEDIVVGSVGRAYPHQTYDRVLAQSQRYFRAVLAGQLRYLAAGVSSTIALVSIPFTTEMRIPPTGITVSSVSGGSVSGVATTNIAFNGAGTDGAMLSVTVAGGLAAQGAYYFAPSTTNIFFTGAEL